MAPGVMTGTVQMVVSPASPAHAPLAAVEGGALLHDASEKSPMRCAAGAHRLCRPAASWQSPTTCQENMNSGTPRPAPNAMPLSQARERRPNFGRPPAAAPAPAPAPASHPRRSGPALMRSPSSGQTGGRATSPGGGGGGGAPRAATPRNNSNGTSPARAAPARPAAAAAPRAAGRGAGARPALPAPTSAPAPARTSGNGGAGAPGVAAPAPAPAPAVAPVECAAAPEPRPACVPPIPALHAL